MPSQVDTHMVPPPEPPFKFTRTRKYFLALLFGVVEAVVISHGMFMAYLLFIQGLYLFGAGLAILFGWLSVELAMFAVRIARKKGQ